MAIVARGLGQPEAGAIVSDGLAATEPAAPGSISATLTGTSTLTADLTATGAVLPSGRFLAAPWLLERKQVAAMSATLTGSSSLSAHLDFSTDFDAELELLLLAGVV